MKVSVAGTANVREQLRLIQERVTTKGVRKAVRAGGEVIKTAMVEDAPFLDHKTAGSNALEPGALKDDIATRMQVDEDGNPIAIIGPGTRTKQVGRWVEEGHVLKKGGKVIGKVQSHPWAAPAFERSVGDAIDAFGKEIAQQVEGKG